MSGSCPTYILAFLPLFGAKGHLAHKLQTNSKLSPVQEVFRRHNTFIRRYRPTLCCLIAL